MYSLHGKSVIVTGASDGIGAQLAALLRARGARLTLTARSESKLRAVAGPDDLVIPCDLLDESARPRIVEETAAKRGGVDILINNAGRGGFFSPLTSPMADSRAMFELNFFAPMHLAQIAAPWLRESRGQLVNVGSIAGQISLPWQPVYSATKFALASLTSTQRIELRRHGVNVMAVFPGYVDTKFQDHAAGSPPPDKVVKGKRFAVTSQECAAAIVAGIEGRKRLVVTPRIGWPLVWACRMFPAFAESVMEGV